MSASTPSTSSSWPRRASWAPLGRAGVIMLRLAGVVALYLLRTMLAPSGTLRGLRQMVLDAAPVPGMTGVRRTGSELLSYPGHDHEISEHGSARYLRIAT